MSIFQLPRRYYIYAFLIFLLHSLLVFLPLFADETPYETLAMPVLAIGVLLATPVIVVNNLIWQTWYHVDMQRYYSDPSYNVQAYPTETFGFTVGIFSLLYTFLYLYLLARKQRKFNLLKRA